MHPRAYSLLVDNGVDLVVHLLLYNVNNLKQLP
jgi:hypothetical protein